MLYCEDDDGIAEIVKANAIFAHTQPQFGRVDILQALHVAFTSPVAR